MPITLDCPRCKQPLAVPTKKIGSYVTCPRCNGRFWVPEGARDAGKSPLGEGAGASEGDLNSSAIVPLGKPPLAAPPGMALPPGTAPTVPPAAAMAAPPPPPPPSRPSPPLPPSPSGGASADSKVTLNPAGGVTRFDWAPPVAGRPSSVPPPPPPPTAPSAKKVARFVAADPAASGVKLAEDGKLPELQLQEGRQERSEKKQSGMNSLTLAALLCLSIGSSIAMVVLTSDQQGSLNSEEHRVAWREIEARYFANLDPNAPLEPYQVCLREARQAATRGDSRTATARLRRVLALLRAERGGLEEKQRRYEGTNWGSESTLTGSPDRDAKLEEYIAILLRQGG